MADTHPGAALVTGAASGIGQACARALAAAGANALVLVDHDAAGLDALAAALSATPCLVRAHDVADEAAWELTEARIIDRFGGLAHAIVNAGIAETSPIAETTMDSWRRVMSVNLDGAFLTLRAAMRLMPGGGGIVTLASVAALKAEAGGGAYCASKAGVLHLSRVAAKEGAAQGIRVNAVCPGGVATPLWRTQPWWGKLVASKGGEAAALEAMAVNTPLGRFASADEIARAILDLLAQRFTTGAALVIDGGYAL